MSTVVACGASTPSSAVSIPSPSPSGIGYLTVGGVQRVYVVYRPTTLPRSAPAPLVIVMHGYTQDTNGIEVMTGFDKVAEASGFVIVYPQGEGNAWNAGSCCGHSSSDDVGFVAALINRLVDTENIDPRRVYATGLSNGGLMVQRLACELADHITAVASVAGGLVTESCKPARAISVLEMHGLVDDLVPFGGGTVQGLTTFPPTESTIQRWASLDSCAAKPTTSRIGELQTYLWSGCRNGTSVVLDTVKDFGHTWFSPDESAGEPDATQVVWDFFRHAPAL
jgi:polyhydroxybutyrate depolymerase